MRVPVLSALAGLPSPETGISTAVGLARINSCAVPWAVLTAVDLEIKVETFAMEGPVDCLP